VVLPQALRMMQPALVGTIVSFVKGSALVVAIGLYDLLGTAMLAAANDKWVGHSVEPLVTVGTVFWAICFSLSRIITMGADRARYRRFRKGGVAPPSCRRSDTGQEFGARPHRSMPLRDGFHPPEQRRAG
jgi:hypothetical protein